MKNIIKIDDFFTNTIPSCNFKLHLPNANNNKDVFLFCFDLFCKGLIFLFGNKCNNNISVNFNNLSEYQLDEVRKKLKLLGISTHILTYDLHTAALLDFPITPKLFPQSIDNINKQPSDLSLNEYVVRGVTNETMFELYFEILN